MSLELKLDKIIELLEILTDQKKPKKKKMEIKSEGSEVWDLYFQYYHQRWTVPPLRNVVVNSLLKAFSQRIPREEWESLMQFYFKQSDHWYLKEMHHPRCLVQHCEMLLTRMRTGVVITSSKAHSMEKLSDNLNASQDYLRNKHRSKDEPSQTE